MKLLSYVSSRAMVTYLLSIVVLLAGLIANEELIHSPLVFALTVAASLRLAWPLIRELCLVAWSVVVHGKWPAKSDVSC